MLHLSGVAAYMPKVAFLLFYHKLLVTEDVGVVEFVRPLWLPLPITNQTTLSEAEHQLTIGQ